MRVDDVLKGHGIGGVDKFIEDKSLVVVTHKSKSFGNSTNDEIRRICYSDNYLFLGGRYQTTNSKILKLNPENMSDVASRTISDTMLYSITVSDKNIYVGFSNNSISKLDINTLKTLDTIFLKSFSMYEYSSASSLVFHEGYIYALINLRDGSKVYKLNSLDMSVVSYSSLLGNIIYDNSDMMAVGNYLYIASHTNPIYKIDVDTMKVVASSDIVGKFLNISSDNMYLYTIIQSDEKRGVYKMKLKDLSFVAQSSWIDSYRSIEFVNDCVLVSGKTSKNPGLTYKLDPNTLEVVGQATESPGSIVPDMATDGLYCYTGGARNNSVDNAAKSWKLLPCIFHKKR